MDLDDFPARTTPVSWMISVWVIAWLAMCGVGLLMLQIGAPPVLQVGIVAWSAICFIAATRLTPLLGRA